jgi:hypothetical protein
MFDYTYNSYNMLIQRDRLTRLDLPENGMTDKAQLRTCDAGLSKFLKPSLYLLIGL